MMLLHMGEWLHLNKYTQFLTSPSDRLPLPGSWLTQFVQK